MRDRILDEIDRTQPSTLGGCVKEVMTLLILMAGMLAVTVLILCM